MTRSDLKHGLSRRPGVRPPTAPAAVLAVLAALALLQTPAAAAPDPKTGEWEGTVQLDTRNLPLNVKLEQAGGEWSGRLRSGGEEAEYEPLDHLSVSGSAISFRYRSEEMDAPVVFSGNYQPRSDSIRGVFLAAGYDVPVVLSRVGLSPAEARAAAVADSLEAEGIVQKVVNIRHDNNFALVARGSGFLPIHVVKEDRKNINDLTTADAGWDAAFRWYLIDDLALNARYFSGGLLFDREMSNPDMARLSDLGLSPDSAIEITGFELGINAYFGDVTIPNSPFNPYFVAFGGLYEWALQADGDDPVLILDREVEGEDYGFGAGLGVEYPVTGALALELEWLWRFFLTQDSEKWEDTERQWTNTHFWDLSLGLILNF